MSSTLDQAIGLTIGVGVLLVIIILLPLLIYSRIILKFLTNKALQDELKGKNASILTTSTELLDDLKNPPAMLLSFSNIHYTVKKSKKEILKGISAWFAPKTLTAILGTSGCGKTTLLTVLANQVEEGTIETTGQIFVNCKEKSIDLTKYCAYVMQSDTLLESLTVRETLWFTAELRLLNKVSQEQKMKIVQQVILDLGLEIAADRLISVLSGGQKRRVTVAVELVARPSLIFLDEPTTGLDASGSLKLVQVLRKLADEGRTIICTIHQPRIDAFNLFHMVLLMNAGKSIYFGPVTRILPYFSQEAFNQVTRKIFLQFENDKQDEDDQEPINPADFVLDVTHGEADEVNFLADEFEKSSTCLSVNETVLNLHTGKFQPNDFFGISSDPDWFPDLHVIPEPILVVPEYRENDDEEEAGVGNKNCEKCCQVSPPMSCDCSSRCCCQYTKYTSTTVKQVFTLTRRFFVSDLRNRSYLCTWVLGIVMMLFLGILYLNVVSAEYSLLLFPTIEKNLEQWGACTQNLTTIGTIIRSNSTIANQTIWTCGEVLNQSQQLAIARSSFIYQLLVAMYFSEFPLVAIIYKDRNLFYKEHASRSYSSFSWIFAWVTKIAFCGLIKGIVYPPFVYFLGHLSLAPTPYFLFSIFMGVMSIAGASIALLSCVLFQSFEAACVFFIFIKTISQALSGYYLPRSMTPWWFRWIFYVNFFSYTYEGTLLSQFLTPQSKANSEVLGQEERYYQTSTISWRYALVSIIFCVCYQLLALIILWYYGARKRLFNKHNCLPSSKAVNEIDKQHLFLGSVAIIGS